MNASLNFELMLLSCMSEEYMPVLLARHGLEASSIEAALLDGAMHLPLEIGIPLDRYEEILGKPVTNREIQGPAPDQEYLRHDFLLMLWPNLVWSIATVEGTVFAFGFRAKIRPSLEDFQSASLRPGEWCLDDLTELGVHWTRVDGWGETGVIKFDFAGQPILGTQSFGLFHRWEGHKVRIPTVY